MDQRSIIRLNLHTLTTRPHFISGVLLSSLGTSSVELCETELGLTSAIRNGKEPDLAHAIYADWLEEQGDSDAVLAHRLAAEGFQWKVISRSHFFGFMYNEKCVGMIQFPELRCWHNVNWTEQTYLGKKKDIEAAFTAIHKGLWQRRDSRS